MALHPPRTFLLLSLLLSLPVACSGQVGDELGENELRFDFEASTKDWTASFTDVSTAQENDVGFVFDQRQLPTGAGYPGSGLYLSGNNVSDDLFMFVSHPVSVAQPTAPYALTFELELASNAPSGCAGIGGAPGESVFLKAGAASIPPDRETTPTGTWRLNVDKGEQSNGGANAQVVGNIANGSTDCATPVYRRIFRHNLGQPLRVTSNDQGLLWVFIGTDSGFEGNTSLYLDTIRVLLDPLPQ